MRRMGWLSAAVVFSVFATQTLAQPGGQERGQGGRGPGAGGQEGHRHGAGGPQAGGQQGGMPDLGAMLKRMDANGDGKISKMEVPQQMQQRWGMMDTNNDGFCDAREQGALIQRFQGQGGGQRGMGPRGGGQPGMGPGGGQRGGPGQGDPRGVGGARRGMPDPGQMLKMMDRDGDGKISAREAPAMMRQQWRMVDVNQDGFVDQKEQGAIIERMRKMMGGGRGGQQGMRAGGGPHGAGGPGGGGPGGRGPGDGGPHGGAAAGGQN